VGAWIETIYVAASEQSRAVEQRHSLV